MTERVRTINEITADLESVQAASAQAHEALEARKKELVRAQTAAIGWNPEYLSPYAADILAFAQAHNLDPVWLGARASDAKYSVLRGRDLRIRSEDAVTAQDFYRLGLSYLDQDHYPNGPFLHAGRDAFWKAHELAVQEEEVSSNVDPEAKDSMFYKFLAQNFAIDLKQIVHDDYWDNY